MTPIPVIVLTGFLGSGKTTLINRILSERHGKKLAVIENEFGEVGVDNDLVVGADEEIFEMNNGCLCCTVRGDLIRILSNLAKRKDRVEMVLIETTGLADPGPVAQTFFMDDDVQGQYLLKGIVTVVDALHCEPHLDQSPEASRQIAFADLLLVNKVDLVSASALGTLKARLRSINPLAPQVDATMAALALDLLWNLAGFRLDKALQLDAAFLEIERPFESALALPAVGRPLSIRWRSGTDSSALAWLQLGEEIDVEAADRAFQRAGALAPEILPGSLVQLTVGKDGASLLSLPNGESGWLFFEHHPDEFSLELLVGGEPVSWGEVREFRPSHQHDDVTSVGLTSLRPLDSAKFMGWLRDLLARKGADIYRSKGILHFRGSSTKQIIQGVHMLLTGGDLGPWGQETPQTRIVFIGRDLDRAELTKGFERCLV